jgi:hypothetical protein
MRTLAVSLVALSLMGAAHGGGSSSAINPPVTLTTCGYSSTTGAPLTASSTTAGVCLASPAPCVSDVDRRSAFAAARDMANYAAEQFHEVIRDYADGGPDPSADMQTGRDSLAQVQAIIRVTQATESCPR